MQFLHFNRFDFYTKEFKTNYEANSPLIGLNTQGKQKEEVVKQKH